MNPTILRRRVEKTLPYIALGLYVGITFLAMVTTPAHGQTATPPLTVGGKTEPEALTSPSAADARKYLEKIPGSTALVEESELREGRAATVKDMLDYVPGVFAQPKYGQEDARLSVRGSGLSRNFHLRGMRLLLDGVPVNQADGAGDFQEIDPLAMRYVEVYKGANAMQFGAVGLGGAVNFVSPTGRSHSGYLLRQEFGSFETSRTQMAAGGALGAFDYYLTPTYSHSEGYRDHTDQDYSRLNGNVGYRFGDGAETRFYFIANSLNQKIVNSLTRADALARPQSALEGNFGNIKHNTKRDINSIRMANKTTWLTDSGEVTVGAYVAHKDLFHPVIFNQNFGIVIENEEQNYGGYARWALQGQIAGMQDELLLGVNYFGGINKAQTFNYSGVNKGALRSSGEEKSNNVEVYADNSLYVRPDVAFVTGLQGSFAERNLVDLKLDDGNDSGSRDYLNFNPRIGLRWDYAPKQQAYTNLSWASEVAPFSELNPSSSTAGLHPLKAQKSITLEAGLRGQHQSLAWDVAVYRAWITDELQLVSISGTDEARNIPKTIHQGVEAGGEWSFLQDAIAKGDRLALRGAYTFSDFRFDGDTAFRDNELPGAPRHYIRTELRYTHANGWFAGPNIEWVPQAYFVDNANTTKTEPYALLGMKAGYEYSRQLRLFLDGRNLLNKTYISNVSVASTATATSALFNPGDGRAIYAGLEWRF